jgi:hypothetical protein
MNNRRRMDWQIINWPPQLPTSKYKDRRVFAKTITTKEADICYLGFVRDLTIMWIP